jgi:hypothetical protein
MVLHYSAPQVLFRGEFFPRSIGGVAAVVAGGSVSAVMWTLSATIASEGHGGFGSRVVAGGFALIGAIFGGLALWALWHVIIGKPIPVEVNEEGVIRGRRLWRWGDVRDFGGERMSGGIQLRFTPRRATFGVAPGALWTTPLLTDAQFDDLIKLLRQTVGKHFPNLIIESVPRVSYD